MNRCVHRAFVFNGLARLQLGTFNYGYYWVKINSDHWETYIKRFQDHVCLIVSKGCLVQLIRIPLLWGKFSYIELKYYIGMSFRVHVSLACAFFHLQFLLGYLGTLQMVSEREWQHSAYLGPTCSSRRDVLTP